MFKPFVAIEHSAICQNMVCILVNFMGGGYRMEFVLTQAVEKLYHIFYQFIKKLLKKCRTKFTVILFGVIAGV